MFLIVGTFILSVGIVVLLHRMITVRFGIIVSRLVLLLIVISLLFTGTVHGIWLALTVMIVGYLWLEYYSNKLKSIITKK